MTRRVLYLTGTRADYGLFSPTLHHIAENPELDLHVLITGMHLAPEFGTTADFVAADGFNIVARVETLLASDSGGAMARSIGLGIIGITQVLETLLPDMVIVLGDRGEMLAGTIAATHLNIVTVHVHGGEVSGTIDESVRHAISKLAHYHFSATPQSRERLIKMGEDPSRVYFVGAPGLTYLRQTEPLPVAQIEEALDLDLSKPVILVTQHPVTTESNQAVEQMRLTLDVLQRIGRQTVITYPNADSGGRQMIQVLLEYLDTPSFRIRKSLGQRLYVSLLHHARVMVGNSSSGIIEAPFFGIPVVNIGSRQQGRERAANVIDVPHNAEAIYQAVQMAMYDETFIEQAHHCANPYGDGFADERITKLLTNISLERCVLQKRLAY
jgi:UDP-N-acetylglucosamine 2-epimerase (non-hydrolysing)/GDP/UDP-N,N'-diacetylbacillosamine 2-epimerase (hydrolysing)